MTSTLSPTAAIPSRASKPEHLTFFVVKSLEITLRPYLTFGERVAHGGFGEVSEDVNERNFRLDQRTAAIQKPVRIQAVVASLDMSCRRQLTTANILGGIKDTDFFPGITAIHLEATARYEGLDPDQGIFSLGALANNWRGHDGQKSALMTRNFRGSLELTNCLLGETRSWRSDSLFLLYKV